MENTLPKNWVETNIGKIADIITGNTPSKSENSFYGNDILWVKPGDLHNQSVIFDTEEKLSKIGSSKARLIPENSIMVTCIGNLGNVSIASQELATNQQINSIVLNHPYTKHKYIYYYFLTMKGWLIANSTSTTISMVNKSIFETAPIILPPLAEQERIVAKLDALFAQHQKMKTALERIPQLLKDFRQQVLTHAVTGKLTPLKKIGIWKGGGTPSKGVKNYWDGGKNLWITAKDMKEMFLTDSLDKITDAGVNESTANLIPKNSILIVMRSGILRRILPVSSNLIEATINQDLKAIIPNKEYFYKYILYALIGLEEYIRNNCIKSGTTVESIEFDLLKNYQIPIPESFQEQEEIVARVESLFAKADAIEGRYKKLKEKIDSLPQALLHKAFKGELVPQLPTDGDAKELLQEILKLKAETKPKKK